MPKVIEGNLNAAGKKFAIISTRFNEFITTRLLDGALDAIKRHGGDADGTDVVWVPGAVEIPLVAQKLANSGKYNAVIALGWSEHDAPRFDAARRWKPCVAVIALGRSEHDAPRFVAGRR